MKPQQLLARAATPDGGELVLYERAGVYSIRVDGLELMSSRAHASEEAMARLVCERVGGLGAPRVVVGGLGIGFTLRAALDELPSTAEVVVSELFRAVVDWNRRFLGELAREPLADPRVEVVIGDVLSLCRRRRPVDAILLDVDNGPEALTLARNARLYAPAGLAELRASLTSDGWLAVWSASPDAAFAARLHDAGFAVETESAPARPGARSPRHTVFLASVAPRLGRRAARARGRGGRR